MLGSHDVESEFLSNTLESDNVSSLERPSEDFIIYLNGF